MLQSRTICVMLQLLSVPHLGSFRPHVSAHSFTWKPYTVKHEITCQGQRAYFTNHSRYPILASQQVLLTAVYPAACHEGSACNCISRVQIYWLCGDQHVMIVVC
jgi:hypothetical protein